MKYAFFAFLGLLLGTFYHRVNHYDEACLAEQSYRFLFDGVVRSEFYRGLNGWENQLFVFHKLFIYLSAVWQAVFGFSLVAGKSFSAVWTVLGGVALWGYLRDQQLDSQYIWLGLLLYISSGLLIEFSFVYRPESMEMTLGFFSFWLLVRNRWAWAALLAGLATLTHLNGFSFIVAGVGWLTWRNNARTALAFGAVAVATASLYLLDVAITGQWPLFWLQFRGDPALIHLRSFSDKLIALTHVGRLLRLTAELIVLNLGITFLTGNRAFTSPTHPARSVGQYSVCLTLGYLLITRSHSSHYLLLFVPFVCSYVALCVASFFTHRPVATGWQRTAVNLLIGCYLFVGAGRAGYVVWLNHTSPDIVYLNGQMARLIGQPGSHIIAPIDFFYEQANRYTIHSVDYFVLQQGFPHHRPEQLTAHLLRAAEAEKAVAVISYDGTDAAYALPRHFGRYERVYQDRWNSLYLRR